MAAQAARQALALSIGLLLWSISAQPTFFALVIAYALSAGALGALGAQQLIERMPRALGVALQAVALASGVFAVARVAPALGESEDLIGLGARIAEGVRVEALPSIAPALVATDRPQTFFVHARPGARVTVRFGSHVAALPARDLGEGLYRVEYDPRRDGRPEPADGSVQASISVGGSETARAMNVVTPLAHPRWLALSPQRTRALAVSEETDELAIVGTTDAPARIATGDGPRDALFLDESHAAVAFAHETALSIVALESPSDARRVEIGAAQTSLALSPNGRVLAVGCAGAKPEVALVGLPELQVLGRVGLTATPDWLAFGADDDTLVVATRADAALHRVRRNGDRWVEDAALALGRPAVTLARSDDGARVFVAVTDYRVDGSSHLGNHFIQDQILTVDLARFAVTSALLTARRSERQSKPGDADRGISPMGMAQAADGSLLIAFAGSDEVWRMREGSVLPEIVDLADTELHAPHGVAELADGTLVVSSPSAGAIGLLARDAKTPRIVRLAPSDADLLAHDRDALERRLGERGFYEGTRAGISCQSCHMHADSDERAHNLGDHRLLPTLSVRGLLGTGPYLRDGSYPRIGDLDHVAQQLYRGYLRRAPGRPETLQAYVESLPRRDNPHAGKHDVQREQRGVRVFVRAGCNGCHAFPAFTNLGQQLVRGLFPTHAARLPADERVDTPSLLSVAAGAPYLNDGRARTLEAVIGEHNRDNHHGDSARLTPAERADLIAFLESL